MALEDGLVSYWKVNETSGNSRSDTQGNNQLSETGGAVDSVSPGKHITAALLKNDSKYLARQIQNLVGMNVDSFSVSLWIKSTTLGSKRTILSMGDTSGQTNWSLAGNADGSLSFAGNESGVTRWSLVSTTGMLATWFYNHIVITRANGGAARIYIENNVHAEDLTSGTTSFGSTMASLEDFALGLASDAAIDEIGYWNRELSAAEVDQLWNFGLGDFYDDETNLKFNGTGSPNPPVVNWQNRNIYIPKAYTTLIQASPNEVRELNLDNLRLDLKDVEDDVQGMAFPTTHKHVGPISVGGVQLARVLEFINGYTVTFEDGQYAVNLQGANTNLQDVATVNQVSIRPNNSAGLTYSKQVEDQSFGDDRVWIDVSAGQAGTSFPLGTPGQPVNNLSDALTIISVRTLPRRLHLRGTLTTALGSDLSGFDIQGASAKLAALQFATGTNTANMVVRACDISGTSNGPITATEVSAFTALGGFEGKMVGGGLATGTITLGDTDADKKVEFIACHSRVSGMNTPTIDCNGVLNLELNVRGYHGGLRLTNVNDASMSVSIDGDSLRITLDSTCTAGTIVIGGTGRCTDLSGPGCSVDTTSLVEGNKLQEIYRFLGLELGTDVVSTDTSTTAGSISQTITDAGGSTTVSRDP